MTAGHLRIRDASLSHEGSVRTVNEDSLLARPADGLWAVADGMGGHSNGQWASQAVVAALQSASLAAGFDAAAQAAAEALHAANERIWREAQSLGKSMGSTVAALVLRDARFAVFWVGDSRCYLLRQGILYRLTSDHSQVQELVAAGHMTEQEAESHPMAHVLSRAMGVEPTVELEAVADQAAAGDVFLLCSDGLTRLAPDAELAAILAGASPAAAAERLLGLCLERGAPDNVSVVVVACDEATLLALADDAPDAKEAR
jgi:serine/threonine protein phosphatase PrpC